MAKPKEAPQTVKGNKPDFVLRARQAPGSDYFMTIGACWEKVGKDGVPFYSLKINSQPVGWDGSCIMVPPLPDRE